MRSEANVWHLLTISACFWAALLKPLRESLRQDASWLKDSGAGCHAMMGNRPRGEEVCDALDRGAKARRVEDGPKMGETLLLLLATLVSDLGSRIERRGQLSVLCRKGLLN